ncbi:MAG: indole-3-glycerol phosphate synthase TrpC [Saprospiraceae bacterium]
MDILDKIVAHKHKEVAARKGQVPVKILEQSLFFEKPVHRLSSHLLNPARCGLIAEFKKKSPSKSAINLEADVVDVTTGYVAAGASALSVLTDEHFFGGHRHDLLEARLYNACPILRKDFVVDEYQIIEAKSIGADAILLIAACLQAEQLHALALTARRLDLEVLVELHDEIELDKLSPLANVVGVNNRNLKTFEVSIDHSLAMFPKLPTEMVRISESGISDPNAVVELRRRGYQGFLIGENFMRSANPGQSCADFIARVKHIESLLDGGIA